MRPASTSVAPAQSTPTMQEPTRKMTNAVITARIRVRLIAAVKDSSTARVKFVRSTSSWVNACTVAIAFSASPA